LVQIKKIETEAEFQEVVAWWNYQREREIFHRWGHLGRTLDSMFPLPEPFQTRREETEAALKPYMAEGEVWVCRDREGRMRHVIAMEVRPPLATGFWDCRDWDYVFTLAPEEIPSGGIPPGIEEDQWDGAPRESLRVRAGLPNPFLVAAQQAVFESLASRGITQVEFREIFRPDYGRKAAITRTPTGYDRWTRKQVYRILVDLNKLMAKGLRNPTRQRALLMAEAL